MTVADIEMLRERVRATSSRLRSLSLVSLAAPTAPGERTRAAAALSVVQLLADLDAVLQEQPADIPLDDDVVYAGDAALGDQLAVVGRELIETLECVQPDDDRLKAVSTAAADALVALRMEL